VGLLFAAFEFWAPEPMLGRTSALILRLSFHARYMQEVT
jgi:hypothetical protein